MSTRIFDLSVLEEPADFTLSSRVPKNIDIKDNVDGSRPAVTLHVVAPSFKAAISVLNLLGEDKSAAFTEILLTQAYSLLNDGADINALSDEELNVLFSSVEFQQFFDKNMDEWHTISFDADIKLKDDVFNVQLTMKAPSFQLGLEAFEFFSSEQTLNSLVANLMPLADDEDDDLGYDGEDDDY